jgi:hypothetical protein
MFQQCPHLRPIFRVEHVVRTRPSVLARQVSGVALVAPLQGARIGGVRVRLEMQNPRAQDAQARQRLDLFAFVLEEPERLDAFRPQEQLALSLDEERPPVLPGGNGGPGQR